MTVTQYIGARYVPLFATPLDWDKTKEYEPLTIVYYAGNSYTSRQAVPADIDITNESYWALTGNYNAQIEQYRREVLGYTTKVDEVVKKVESLECYVNVLSYGVSTKNADNADLLQTAINDTTEKGLILYIPNGTYQLSHSISVPWYAAIIGQSKPGCILKFTSNAGLVADITDSNGYKSCIGATLKNFTIEGSYDGYATKPKNLPWYSRRYDYEYMALNYSGLGGWFTVCDIDNIRIRKFPYGLLSYQSVTDGEVFNDYNGKYGDLRLYRNIDASYCNTGIALHQWDSMLIGFDVNHCYYLGGPVRMTGGFCSNGHSWATNEPWAFISGVSAENIEIEAVYSAVNDDGSHQFDSFLLIDGSGNYPTTVNNLKLWNIKTIYNDGGYNHAAIRTGASYTKGAVLTNVVFGKNSDIAGNNYPVALVEAASGCITITGELDETFTVIGQTAREYAFSGQAQILSGIVSKNADVAKGVINFSGFNTMSIEHV